MVPASTVKPGLLARGGGVAPGAGLQPFKHGNRSRVEGDTRADANGNAGRQSGVGAAEEAGRRAAFKGGILEPISSSGRARISTRVTLFTFVVAPWGLAR